MSGRKYDFKYLLTGLICLLFVMTRYFPPEFYDNEWVYAIGPIKMMRASFLANDPFIGKIDLFFLVYNSFVSPFYYFLNPLVATFIIRILIWIFQVWALFRLTKTLGVSWWGSILLLVLWLNVEQTLVAGEWMIGCASAKPVAYGFVFLALSSLLRGELKLSGIFSGLAISVHIIVGLWSAIALLFTILFTFYSRDGIKGVLSYCIASSTLSLPGIVPALYGTVFSSSKEALNMSANEVAKMSVLFANPFHLDPQYFVTGLEYMKVILFFILTIILMKSLLPKEKGIILIIFITCLSTIFAFGIIARYTESYRFLMYYPFRVIDAFLPLSFWMGFVLFSQKVFYKLQKKGFILVLFIPFVIGGSNYLIELCEPKPVYDISLKSFSTSILRNEPRLTAYWIRESGREWHKFLFHRPVSELEEMEFWVRNNTPPGSVFITPPWEFSFPLKAERSEFVSFKNVPVNENIFQWKARMEALNRGQFHGVGTSIFYELKENYPKLTKEELERIKVLYGADYILTISDVHLNLGLVHENKSYRLYKL